MEINSIPGSLIEYLDQLSKRGVPENKYYKYINKYFELSAREKGIPLHGSFELTPLCNLDCKMCYVHLNNDQFATNRLMGVEVWKKLIEEAYESGMRNASLTGGECLTYPAFNDVYLFLFEKGVRTGILTNGVLLNRDRINFLLKYPPRNIQVTVYGSNDDAYEKVTGRRVFSIVKENILMARDAGLPIKIAITPSRFMWEDMDAVLEAVDQLEVPYYINAFLSTPRENTGRKKEDLTVEQYISVYKKKNSLKHIEELPAIDPVELPDVGHGANSHYGLKCGAARSSFIIKYDGSMSPCTALGHITSKPLQVGFKQAWKQINDIANTYLLPAECEDCVYRSVCLKCASLHIDAPRKGHCNPLVCERTKKMISAGVLPMPRDNRTD